VTSLELEPETANATMTPVNVSVVVPCFNEAQGIHYTLECLLEARQALAPLYDLRFIFVDDGSTDNTHALLIQAAENNSAISVLQHTCNRGMLTAILTGLHAAETEIVCSIDADCTYHPLQLKCLLSSLTPNVSMVTASPYHPHGKVEQVPAWRLKISGICSQLYRCIMLSKLYTYTSCFRVYRKSILQLWQPKHLGFVGLVEMIRFIEEQGGQVSEAPATLSVRKFGQSKMRILRVTAQHFAFIFRMGCYRLLQWRYTKIAPSADSVKSIAAL
jgi:dolichol-phosphate mannosyltransferase